MRPAPTAGSCLRAVGTEVALSPAYASCTMLTGRREGIMSVMRTHLSRRVGAASPEASRVRHGRFFAGEALLLALIAALAAAVKGHPTPFPDDVRITLAVQHLLLPHRLLTD